VSRSDRWWAWTFALGFFCWEVLGVALWLRDEGGPRPALAHFAATATGDWMNLLWLTDGAMFILLAAVWLWRDTGRRRWSPAPRAGVLAAMLVLGSPVLLAYLARRR
jgi:hypothetical protein